MKLLEIQKTLLIVLTMVVFASTAYSEDEKPKVVSSTETKTGETCELQVRSLKGFEHSHDRTDQEHQIKKELLELKDTLEKLPFGHYEEIASQIKEVAIETKAEFSLPCAMGNLHHISVVPHGVAEDQKVDFTVTWINPYGETMVSSRMRVPNGVSIALGTEHPSETCTIMTIKVKCP